MRHRDSFATKSSQWSLHSNGADAEVQTDPIDPLSLVSTPLSLTPIPEGFFLTPFGSRSPAPIAAGEEAAGSVHVVNHMNGSVQHFQFTDANRLHIPLQATVAAHGNVNGDDVTDDGSSLSAADHTADGDATNGS